MPINHPPTADSVTYTLLDTSILTFQLSETDLDPDQTPSLQFAIVSPFELTGYLTFNGHPVTTETWIQTGSILTYLPVFGSNVTDVIQFIVNDGIDNSTRTGMITFISYHRFSKYL